jgi:hypothetical protein
VPLTLQESPLSLSLLRSHSDICQRSVAAQAMRGDKKDDSRTTKLFIVFPPVPVVGNVIFLRIRLKLLVPSAFGFRYIGFPHPRFRS